MKNSVYPVITECLSEINTCKNINRDTLLSEQVVKRLEKFSHTVNEETAYSLAGIRKKILNNDKLSVSKKAKEIDKFSRVATGVSTTYLGFLSRLIKELFVDSGGR